MNPNKRRIAFSSNRAVDGIAALVIPSSSKAISFKDSYYRYDTLQDGHNK